MRCLLLLLCLVESIHASRPIRYGPYLRMREPSFVGWEGEVYKPDHENGAKSAPESSRRWIETVSWAPRAAVFHNFMTAEECDHVVELAKPQMQRSYVVDSTTGKARMDSIRTSSGTFLRKQQDDIIKAIETRVAIWTRLPPENQESMQVLKYEIGQKYDSHWDWFQDQPQFQEELRGGNRIATVVMYLKDVEEGGETVFPRSEWIDESMQKQTHISECAKQGVAAIPKKGDAVLFWDFDVGVKEADEKSLHASCPVLQGTKWTATKWIHASRFEGPPVDPGECKDYNELCKQWALDGECKNNSGYMVGDPNSLGQCRFSCKACKPCIEGDPSCGDHQKNKIMSVEEFTSL